MQEVLNGFFLSGCFIILGVVFLMIVLVISTSYYFDHKEKLMKVFIFLSLALICAVTSYGFNYVKRDKLITKEDAPIEYNIIKGKTETHISGAGLNIVTCYSFNIDTNNVFSFYYLDDNDLYKKESIVIDENFYIKEINEDKCFIEIKKIEHFRVYESRFLGTAEVSDGKDVIVYLYVPAGTLSSGGGIILD